MKVAVTGSTGFLGRHLLPVLVRRYGQESVTGLSTRDYNLMDPAQVEQFFLERKPEVVVHLAAYSGGIGVNRRFPADFYYRNTLLTALVFHAAAAHGVKKLVYTMGGCSYPATARSPIDEGQMWDGFPQPESAGYSAAKKMGIVASKSYRSQYGLDSVVIVPGNMYGEYDNYRTEESHVVPAVIRRCHEARLSGAPKITMWGSGKPRRDFVYAGDVAALIPYFIEEYSSSEPVNVSSGSSTSIGELAELVRGLTGFEGSLEWDTSRPDGQMVKIFCIERMKGLGLSCPTPLRAGLSRTIRWFMKNYEGREDGLRL